MNVESEKEVQTEAVIESRGNEAVKTKINIPNIITSFRIFGTFILLFTTALSPLFYVVYTLCGLSDVVDGYIARVTKSTSEFGAKLDSVADLFFYIVMFSKVFPLLLEILPLWIWCFAFVAAGIRIMSYIVAALKFKRFSSMHTYMNKLTGLSFFLLPYFIREIYCVGVCVVASLASLEELIMHIRRKEYNTTAKTLVQLR